MKRRNKKSSLKMILKRVPMVLGICILGYAIFLINNSEVPTMFPIDEVNIVGELKFLDKAKIAQIVGDNIAGGYFTVDLNKARDVLLQQPWLKSVSLRRQWPASLNVFLEEQVPIAFWNDDSYIGDNGNVFKPESIDRRLNLPVLHGPVGQHENVWQFMNILYKEMALLEYEVVRLDLDNRRAWQLEVTGLYGKENMQISVKLGRFETEKRLRRFVHILPALMAENSQMNNMIKVIDMRYPNGFAVQIADKNISNIDNITHDFAYWYAADTMQISGA